MATNDWLIMGVTDAEIADFLMVMFESAAELAEQVCNDMTWKTMAGLTPRKIPLCGGFAVIQPPSLDVAERFAEKLGRRLDALLTEIAEELKAEDASRKEAVMARHCIGLAYKPKADALFAGTCRNDIRMGRRFRVGDTVTIYEWEGVPYRKGSKWGRRLTVTLNCAYPVILSQEGVVLCHDIPISVPWVIADGLATDDGIDPPTGAELKRVLESYHGPLTGQEAQILRW